eukprot:802011-Ditylum_brightwellii.AAC.1
MVIKEKAAQRITDTVKFKHHGTKVPMVTLAERVAKAVKELTSAVCNEPTDGPPDYIKAVQRLWVVLLKEQQPTREELIKSGGKYNTPQQKLVTTEEPISTNPIPSHHPALISSDDDKIEVPVIKEAPIIPAAPLRRYNLREKATHIINS